eukprot:6868501-Pyramimonas_sp.AAC.1
MDSRPVDAPLLETLQSLADTLRALVNGAVPPAPVREQLEWIEKRRLHHILDRLKLSERAFSFS